MPRKLKDDTYVDGPPPLELSSEAKDAVQETTLTDAVASQPPIFRRGLDNLAPNAGLLMTQVIPAPQTTTGAEDLADMIATLAAGDGLQVPAREWAAGPWLLAAGALLKKGFDLRIAYIAKPEEEPFYRVVADR